MSPHIWGNYNTNSQGQKVEEREEGMGGFLLNGCRVSALDDANGQQWWLHNTVNALNATELYIYKRLING